MNSKPMKKLFFGLCILCLCCSGCQNTSQNKNQSKAEHTETGDPDELRLDNGHKWAANKETTDGVKKIQVVMEHNPQKSIEDFHKLGRELTEIERYIVRKCTMKGEAHENLHLWLNPLMKKTEKLNESENLAQAKKIAWELEIHLKAYFRYFE